MVDCIIITRHASMYNVINTVKSSGTIANK